MVYQRKLDPQGSSTSTCRARILLVGYFNRGNLGDDAMHQGLLEFYSEQFPDIEISSLPLPPWTLRSVAKTFHLLHKLWRSDAVVLAGGTHFHDAHKLRSHRILITHWLVFGSARLLGKRVGYAGVGIGPLRTRLGRWLTRRLANTAEAILVRDESSADTLRTLDTRIPFVRGFDSAVLLKLPTLGQTESNLTLGVSLLPYFTTFENNPQNDNKVIASLAHVVQQLPNKDLKLDILAFHTQGFISDVPISKALLGRLSSSAHVYECHSPYETLARLKNLGALLATRYHAALLGYVAGLPMIIVAYHEKCAALATEIGLPPHALITPADLLDSNRLSQTIRALMHDPDYFRPSIPQAELQQHAVAGLTQFMDRLLVR